MLVLSRKPTERIRITGGITITIVKVNGDIIELGIEAPPDVRLLRDELVETSEPDVARSQTGHSKVTAFKPVPELVES